MLEIRRKKVGDVILGKKNDLSGQIFGKLFVLGRGEDYVSPSGAHLFRWKCKCECGNIINATTSQLKRGLSSCGCVSKRENLIGKKFGKLTVVAQADDYVSPKGFRMAKWHCKCECGNEIDVLGMSLKNGDTKSCGCYNKTKIRPVKDYTGRQFGDLFVIGKIENSNPTKYLCECSCGNKIEVLPKYLTSSKKMHCGCKTVRKKPVVTHHVKPHDYIGESFGQLTVLEELEPHITPNSSKQRIIKCQCSCGNVFITRLTEAKANKKCRNCLNKDRRADITGKRFGKLVVTSMSDDYISPTGHRLSRCNCICDCGNTCIVNMSSLVTGGTKSCGCVYKTSGLFKDNAKLMQKFDFEKNKALNLDIDSLTARSNTKVWWKCDKCGNSWLAQIASQNDKNKEHGCPYCSGRFVIKGKTDLLSQFPDVAKEWNHEKNTISPNEISSHSNQKVWWKCSKCNNEWKAVVSNRVSGSGCPKCNMENVNSFCEQAVYYYVKQAYPDAVNSDMHIGMELDIYIPSLSVAIEYDGEAWHRSKKKIEIDIRKNELCASSNINMIRIREPKLSPIDNCISFVRKDSTTNGTLDAVISEVLQYLGIDNPKVDTLADTSVILEQFATKKYKNSLAYLYPDIAAEWHPTKNGNLTPDKVNKAARYKVWWLGKCGHEWQMAVGDRTRAEHMGKDGKIHKPQGCPYCSHKRVLVGFNDLQTTNPGIAAEWHPAKNGNLKPTDIFAGSGKKVWWLGKCGHEWQSTPNKRCNDNKQCPICYKERRSPSIICMETGQIFENVKEATNFCGLKSCNMIYRCCRGEQKTAGGYHWAYYENDEVKYGE